MIYLISDTHFSHSNIIEYTNRPFKSIEAMNSHIIKKWNATVSNKDVIYHLGDFGWGDKEEISQFVNQLNGYKILIKGNHDKKSKIWFHDAGFNDVIDGGVLLKNRFLLTHKPVSEYYIGNMINICGHIHNNDVQDSRWFNVCVEKLNYTPILFDKIVENYNKKEKTD